MRKLVCCRALITTDELVINILASQAKGQLVFQRHSLLFFFSPSMKVADLVRKVTVKALCWHLPGASFPDFTTEAVHQGCYVCRLSEPAGDPSYLHSFSSFEAVIIIRCQLCADTEFYFVFFMLGLGLKYWHPYPTL